MLSFQPIRSPLAPNILITGIVPSESSIFKSALHPLRLTFRTASGGTCKMIFKKGDDIRQDQLVNCYISLLPRTKSTTILTLFPSPSPFILPSLSPFIFLFPPKKVFIYVAQKVVNLWNWSYPPCVVAIGGTNGVTHGSFAQAGKSWLALNSI